MQLFTDEQYQKLLENGSSENSDKDHPPVVKLFLPGSGCTWLISEIDPDEPDRAFGLCDLNMGCPELGYVSIAELQELRHPYLDLPIERDMFFDGEYPLTIYADAARIAHGIIEHSPLLNAFYVSKYNPKLTP